MYGVLTFTPIFARELMAVERKACLQWDRSVVVTVLVAIVIGTLVAQWYWAGGIVSHSVMARVGQLAFGLAVAFHALWVFGVPALAGRSIAFEKERRTLDFLLATRLSNAEIVLGKFAAFLLVSLMTLGAGVPVMVLLVLVGGVDARLVLIMYGCVISTSIFLAALSIWVSTSAPDVRRASGLAVLCTMGWTMGPMLVAMVLPRIGIHLPSWALAANGWLISSSPLGMMFIGAGAGGALLAAAGWMVGLQAIGSVLLLIWAIARLRSAYRVNTGGDGRLLGRVRRRPVWRFRPRPAVSDSPILWRVMHTTRASGFEKLVSLVLSCGILATLAFLTYHFGRPAVLEVWNHGYASGATTDRPPEMNLLIRLFVPVGSLIGPIDEARTDFNVLLRHLSASISFMILLFGMATPAEIVANEKARETWPSLLATMLEARDFASTYMLAGAWRMRGLIGSLIVLWTVGLFAGAIHPVGYVVALVELAVSTWAFLAFGAVAALKSKNLAANLPNFAVALALPSVLVFMLPFRFRSVLMGAGSLPFIEWLSLLSYRDVRAGLHYAAYPPLEWMGIKTGEGPLRAVATCLIGLIVPALLGRYAWRYFLAHFDRLVGRPGKGPDALVKEVAAQPSAVQLQPSAG